MRPRLLLGPRLACIHLLNLRLTPSPKPKPLPGQQDLFDLYKEKEENCLRTNLCQMMLANLRSFLTPPDLRNRRVMQGQMTPDTARMKKEILSLMNNTGLFSQRSKSYASTQGASQFPDM